MSKANPAAEQNSNAIVLVGPDGVERLVVGNMAQPIGTPGAKPHKPEGPAPKRARSKKTAKKSKPR